MRQWTASWRQARLNYTRDVQTQSLRQLHQTSPNAVHKVCSSSTSVSIGRPLSSPFQDITSNSSICLVSSVSQVVGRSDACSFMCAGGPGPIPGADNLDSEFQSSRVGKMSSSQRVVADRYRRLRMWLVRPWEWPRVAAGGANYHTRFLADSTGDLEVPLAIRRRPRKYSGIYIAHLADLSSCFKCSRYNTQNLLYVEPENKSDDISFLWLNFKTLNFVSFSKNMPKKILPSSQSSSSQIESILGTSSKLIMVCRNNANRLNGSFTLQTY